MLRRSVLGLAVVALMGGLAAAEEFTGTITKIEGSSITVKQNRGFGGGFGTKKKKTDDTPAPEEKTFKVSPGDVKIVRIKGKGDDKEELKLTYDELKVAVKVTNVMVTIVHDGDKGSEIKIGFGGGFGGAKKKKKKDE
jgi:hypothetical protein